MNYKDKVRNFVKQNKLKVGSLVKIKQRPSFLVCTSSRSIFSSDESFADPKSFGWGLYWLKEMDDIKDKSLIISRIDLQSNSGIICEYPNGRHYAFPYEAIMTIKTMFY